MIREMNGVQEMVNGTMAAVVPMEEPTISRVRGMMATMRMMKGTERRAFTMEPRVLWRAAFSLMCPFPVMVRITPRGMPKRDAMAADRATM